MRTSELDYELPNELIAKRPPHERDGGRLLVIGSNAVEHLAIRDWPELVEPGSLVVLNESRVIKARLLGRRAGSGGRVEILLLRAMGAGAGEQAQIWEAMGRANRPLRVGTVVEVGSLRVTVVQRGDEGTLVVKLSAPHSIAQTLDQVGRVPIPPYLRREDDAQDADRYQTVYACEPGSVAAPTAGLHLTESLLTRLVKRGVRIERLCLHVGMGTFRQVVADDLNDHPMHPETFSVTARLASAISATRQVGAPVVAVGTTVVRALESAACPERPGEVRPCTTQTRLLIQPGHEFRVVDSLLTNFHQPRSTLLALVGAFAGMSRIREAYRVAVRARYRFLSYGDAMWIPRRA